MNSNTFKLQALSVLLLCLSCNTHPDISLDKIKEDVKGKSLTVAPGVRHMFTENGSRQMSIIDADYQADIATIKVQVNSIDNFNSSTYEGYGTFLVRYVWKGEQWSFEGMKSLTFVTALKDN